MNYKIQHTKKHIEQGFRHFKLVADCNSEKAEKSLKEFCEGMGYPDITP